MFLLLTLLTLNIFLTFVIVSIVDIEQVNVKWEYYAMCQIISHIAKSHTFFCLFSVLELNYTADINLWNIPLRLILNLILRSLAKVLLCRTALNLILAAASTKVLNVSTWISCTVWYMLLLHTASIVPASNYMFRINNKNIRIRCETCSKLTMVSFCCLDY